MTLQRTALLAGIGALLRGLYYCVANLLPSWTATSQLPGARALLILSAIAEPVIWAFYFGSIWLQRSHRAAALAACVVTLVELFLIAIPQYRSLSLFSIDTMMFLFGAALPAVCWATLLLRQAYSARLPRLALIYLVFLSVLQTAYIVYQIASTIDQIRAFGVQDPWNLILVPAIWLFFGMTQVLFLRTILKAPVRGPQ
jgi:hypothetical protein